MTSNITVNAGRGGKVKNYNLAGVITSKEKNESSGKLENAGVKTDLSKVKIEVNGPRENLEVEEMTTAAIVEGGFETNQTEIAEDNRNQEDAVEIAEDNGNQEDAVAMEQATYNNPVGLL